LHGLCSEAAERGMSNRDLLNLGRAIVTRTVMNGHPRRKGDEFPLTGEYVQKEARRLGRPVGEHRALEIIKLLIDHRLVVEAGSYRQSYDPREPSGFRVRLFRLPRIPQSARRVGVSVRGRRDVKPWWKHSLFGFGVETYPKDLPKKLRRWKEPLNGGCRGLPQVGADRGRGCARL
jgi:hypothetical protein